MDSNGLRFWMLADEGHWTFTPAGNQPPSLHYDAVHRVLRLANQRPAPDWPASEPQALGLLDIPPQAIDPWGTRAFWSIPDSEVMATGATLGDVPVFLPAGGDAVTDLAYGYDDVLYIAAGGHIIITDPNDRFAPYTVPDVSGFKAWRIAADPTGGVWILDRANLAIGRLRGLPSTLRPHPDYAPGTFRPTQENPDPPAIEVAGSLKWPATETPVAIAVNRDSRIALLTWRTADYALVRTGKIGESFGPAVALAGARRPYSMAWISATQIALMLPGLGEAPVYPIDETGSLAQPVGDIYPLRDHDGGPFLNGITLPPRYPMTSSGGSGPVAKLSLPSYARNGEAANAMVIDSGDPFSVWHRLYLEARIPDACGVIVRLAPVGHPSDHVNDQDWHVHKFGKTFSMNRGVPLGAWVPAASEVPFCPPMLACAKQKDRAGLFTVLIQRSGRAVSAVRGRYLKIRVELVGDGRSTPEVAAVRAYASRFSYAAKYLPELYREQAYGPDADRQGSSTPADFLERFLDNFEGVLTPLEDKIASSYLVTTPQDTPAEALEWLGSWIGVVFDSAYTEAQRRELIQLAPQLFRQRGTLAGLTLALDIATGGAVTGGQIVVLEDYRLRRTFATILGANLDNSNDPLLEGSSDSGNSFVGDTLFLGNSMNADFLALYADNLAKTKSERAAVEAFYDEFAYRVSVLVNRDVSQETLGLIRRIVVLETPAHVLVTVKQVSHGFLAGLSSLIGVDTYLGAKKKPATARIDVSSLGSGDVVRRSPALDPRLEGEDLVFEKPIADAGPHVQTLTGESFGFDASKSQAFEGRTIARYIWKMID